MAVCVYLGRVGCVCWGGFVYVCGMVGCVYLGRVVLVCGRGMLVWGAREWCGSVGCRGLGSVAVMKGSCSCGLSYRRGWCVCDC